MLMMLLSIVLMEMIIIVVNIVLLKRFFWLCIIHRSLKLDNLLTVVPKHMYHYFYIQFNVFPCNVKIHWTTSYMYMWIVNSNCFRSTVITFCDKKIVKFLVRTRSLYFFNKVPISKLKLSDTELIKYKFC